jgi:hypothetical protein
MKKMIWLVLLLLPTLAAGANNPADYTVNVHVSSSYRSETTGALRLKVTINGEKFLLGGGSKGLLMLGDYKAKVLKDEHASSYQFNTVYQLLYPDGKMGDFEVRGTSE